MTNQLHDITQKYSQRPMREKCPNTEFFLVRIFQYSLRIEKTPYFCTFFTPLTTTAANVNKLFVIL